MSDLIQNMKIFEGNFFSYNKAYLEDFDTRIFHLEHKILLEIDKRNTEKGLPCLNLFKLEWFSWLGKLTVPFDGIISNSLCNYLHSMNFEEIFRKQITFNWTLQFQ